MEIQQNTALKFEHPYYWNISPNMDATISPRLLTDSGVMAMGEYRYLFTRSSGEVNFEYLPSDNTRGDKQRNLFGLTHNQTFADTGKLFFTYNRVSDKFYFEDFGNQLSITSTRFLEQRAEISYRNQNWNILTRIQNYQTVDRSITSTSRPYKRLPQVQFNFGAPKQNNKLHYGINSEAVYFQRGESNDFSTNVNGLRLDLNPYISYPASSLAAFIEPKLRFRYTQYALDESAEFGSSPNRLLPVLSLDSGIFLERELNLFNKSI